MRPQRLGHKKSHSGYPYLFEQLLLDPSCHLWEGQTTWSSNVQAVKAQGKSQQTASIYCPTNWESHRDIQPKRAFIWLLFQLQTETTWDPKWEPSDDPNQPMILWEIEVKCNFKPQIQGDLFCNWSSEHFLLSLSKKKNGLTFSECTGQQQKVKRLFFSSYLCLWQSVVGFFFNLW